MSGCSVGGLGDARTWSKEVMIEHVHEASAKYCSVLEKKALVWEQTFPLGGSVNSESVGGIQSTFGGNPFRKKSIGDYKKSLSEEVREHEMQLQSIEVARPIVQGFYKEAPTLEEKWDVLLAYIEAFPYAKKLDPWLQSELKRLPERIEQRLEELTETGNKHEPKSADSSEGKDVAHQLNPFEEMSGLRDVENAKAATIHYELAILKRMFSLAIEKGKLTQKPHIPMIEVRNVRTGFFEEVEFRAVQTHLPEEVRAVAEFAYLTGWRKQEILKLQWRQVDFTSGTVRLEPGVYKER